MAVEKNPFDLMKSNVVPMDIGVEEESMTSIQPDDDGGVLPHSFQQDVHRPAVRP